MFALIEINKSLGGIEGTPKPGDVVLASIYGDDVSGNWTGQFSCVDNSEGYRKYFGITLYNYKGDSFQDFKILEIWNDQIVEELLNNYKNKIFKAQENSILNDQVILKHELVESTTPTIESVFGPRVKELTVIFADPAELKG